MAPPLGLVLGELKSLNYNPLATGKFKLDSTCDANVSARRNTVQFGTTNK